MLISEKIFKRIVATFLIFLLVLSNFVPIARNIVLAVEKEDEAVLVNGYFSNESIDKTDDIVCDTSENLLKVNFEILMNQKGYLKSGSLKFPDNLNFEISEESEVKLKDNEIKIKGISKNKSELISLPIVFRRDDVLDSNYLSATNKIVFYGIYVDNEAIEHKIEKEINLKLSWKENTSSKLESSVIKNIDYDMEDGHGKILQTLVKVCSNNGDANLPVKNTELRIDIPKITGMELQNASVSANKLSYTQGRKDLDIEFSEENYKIEEDKLIIAVGNNEKDGSIYNSYGEDVYTITYMYVGENSTDNLVGSNIDFTVNTYVGTEEKQSVYVEYDLNDVTNNAVEYTKEDRECDISKGYLVANSQLENYEITYERKDVLNISRADLIDSLQIADKTEYFTSNDGSVCYTENENSIMSYYKTSEFSRENLISVLGEEGRIEVLNMNDEVIGTISFDMETDENGKYILNYDDLIGKVKFRTSKPMNDGNISILSTKGIKKLDYSRDVIKGFEKIVNVSEGFVTYSEGIVDNLGEVVSTVNITKTISNANLQIGQTDLSTTVTNECVNFKIRLNNSDDISDLYENPVFEIRLPHAIREINIRNIDLFYSNGELEIANVENFIENDQIVIRITLKGLQNSYNLNKETNGTVVSFDVDLGLDEFTGNETDNVEMYYYNADSTGYENETDWNMFLPSDGVSYLKNGTYIVPLSFKAPEGLLNGQLTETKQEENNTNSEEQPVENEPEKVNKENRVSSVKQGAQSELIEEGADAKLATMYISVMNNTSGKYSNFQILGRVPFAGNKDITTGRDLGTTVDTILDTEIKAKDSSLLYTVYYSENGEANNDLSDESNGWNTNFYKMGTVKSYLILLNSEYVLEPNQTLEFEYDYVIPANLSSGDAFFGTYTTYYEEESGNVTNSSADEIGYKTLPRTTVESSMKLNGDVIKEGSDAEFEVILKNTGSNDAENVELILPVINGLAVAYVRPEDEAKPEITLDNVVIHKELLRAGEEKKFIVGFSTSKIDNDIEILKIGAIVKADNADEFLFETPEIQIEKKIFSIMEVGIYDDKVADDKTNCMFSIANVYGEDMHDVVITKQLSKEISVDNVQLRGVDSIDFDYDQVSGLLTFTIPKMGIYDSVIITYDVCLNSEGLTGNEFSIDSLTTCSFADKSISFENKVVFDLLDIDVKLVNSTGVGYISENDEPEYKYEVINNSKFDIFDIRLLAEDSGNMETETLDISKNGKNFVTKNTDDFSNAGLLSLGAGEKMTVTTKSKIFPSDNSVAHKTLKISVGNKEFVNERNYSIIEDSQTKENYELTGCAYVDTNKNQIQDEGEQSLPGIIVDLYNSETNEKVDSMITNVSGRYIFKGLDNGRYYVRFNYDETEYVLSSQRSEVMIKNKSNVMNINDNYMTDNISIDNLSVGGVDLQLSDENIFDMKIDAGVSKMTVQNSAESNVFEQNGTKLAKVDIDPKLVGDSKVLIEYDVIVKNQGTIPGKVNKLVDYMTDDMEFDSSLNPDWYLGSDGNVYTMALKDDVINPGEERKLTLILIKNVTEDNTGLVHNTIEIADCINDKGIADIDSTPNNQLDEDDLSYADAIVGVSTGLMVGMFPIVMVLLVALIVISVFAWRAIEKRRYV